MNRSLARLRALPVTLKVPLIVVVLMVSVSAILSNQVLVRLSATQERHLEELTGAYLDGLSASLIPQVLREDIWEIYDQLDRTRHAYEGVRAVNTIVTEPGGIILAATDPHEFPSQASLPASLEQRFAEGADLVLDEDKGRAFIRRALSYQDLPIGWIYAEIDIGDLLAERREVLVALILTNIALTLALAGAGYLVVRRMIRPIDTLAEHLDRGRGGRMEPIPEQKIGARHSEFGRLFRRYNALVRAVNQREELAARLADEERMASLGRLASGMAHEINNPLGGMFNAIDTLEHHGDEPEVRRSSLALLQRGLIGIRDVVRAALVTYKSGASRQPLQPSELDDLRFLVRPEVVRRRLTLMWNTELPGELPLPAGPLRQSVLNLLLNACAASPLGGRVDFAAGVRRGELVIGVSDQGPGMPPEVAAVLESDGRAEPPPTQGRGLGAWMVSRLVRELGGRVTVTPRPQGGTTVKITIPVNEEGPVRHVA
jgi:signal transduction histidine kinase